MGGRFSNVSQTLFLAKLTRERSRPFRLRQPRSSLQLGALQSEAFQPYSRSAAFNLLQPCGLATCSRQLCGLQLQPCSLPAFSFAAMQPCSLATLHPGRRHGPEAWTLNLKDVEAPFQEKPLSALFSLRLFHTQRNLAFLFRSPTRIGRTCKNSFNSHGLQIQWTKPGPSREASVGNLCRQVA